MTDPSASPPPRPKCIVMPLRPEPGQTDTGVGLGLHFLIGNIIVLHSTFQEFWFGWRYKKIFPEEAAFVDYAHSPDQPFDTLAAGNTQKVRYWVEGDYRVRGDVVDTRLILTDTAAGQRMGDARLEADPDGQYIGYRVDVMNWMAVCGLPFPDVQSARVLWSEELSLAGLDLLGKGLGAYYRHLGYGGRGPVDTAFLDRAAVLAPGAYLVHDLLGWVRYKNEDYAAAEKAFRAAIDINPHGAGALGGLMWVAVVTGNTRDAYAWAEAKAEACGASVQDAREKTARLLKKRAGS